MTSRPHPQEIAGAPASGSGVTGATLQGPWMSGFWMCSSTRLRSKSNFRRTSGTRRGEWRENKDFEQQLALSLRTVLPAGWPMGDPELPVQQRPVYLVVTIARSTLDTGNHSKSILDAAEGVVYVNDSQVAFTAALAERGRANPYLFMAFAALRPQTSSAEIAAAGQELLARAVEVFGNSFAAPGQ